MWKCSSIHRKQGSLRSDLTNNVRKEQIQLKKLNNVTKTVVGKVWRPTKNNEGNMSK